jgi:hypothetical protein
MLRQVGLAVGVAVLVAVLGTPHTASASLTAFRQGWAVIATASLLAALLGTVLLRSQRSPAPAAAAQPTPAAGG